MNKLKESSSLSTAKDKFIIIIKLAAPKVVIPDNFQLDNGCLLCNMGHLNVTGEVSPVGMMWNVSLSQVSVALPNSMNKRYCLLIIFIYLYKLLIIIIFLFII
jgi:hypothetical protein